VHVGKQNCDFKPHGRRLLGQPRKQWRERLTRNMFRNPVNEEEEEEEEEDEE
jgi:hypothetical protein